MKILKEKSGFLRLAYQAQVEGAADHGHLEVVEHEVRRLHKELGSP